MVCDVHASHTINILHTSLLEQAHKIFSYKARTSSNVPKLTSALVSAFFQGQPARHHLRRYERAARPDDPLSLARSASSKRISGTIRLQSLTGLRVTVTIKPVFPWII